MVEFSKELSPFVSNGKKRKDYWPIVKQVEVFVPNCEVLKNGLVLVDIPGISDPNPVRKVVAEEVIWVLLLYYVDLINKQL